MTVWRRSGAWLTAPGRDPKRAFDAQDGFVLGVTEPTWANSGCRIPEAQLTRYVPPNGTTELITTSDGQVISGLLLQAERIQVRHKNVIIRDCIIRYGPADGRLKIQNHCAIVHHPSFDTSGNIVEHCTFDPVNAKATADTNDAAVSGMFGFGFTAYRCAVRNVTDGFMPDVSPTKPQPSRILGCYIQTRYLTYDPEQSDGTHNDGVQIAGGLGHEVIGNSIRNMQADGVTGLAKGQSVVLTPYHLPLCANIVIERNWFYHGYTQVAAWIPMFQGGPGIPGLVIRGNRHHGTCIWPILVTPATNLTKRNISGNVAGTGGLTWNNGTTTTPAGSTPTVQVVANNQ